MYLESDTASGNFEAGISKCMFSTYSLQFTHCAEILFLQHCLRKSIVTFTPSNSIECVTLQNAALYKVLHHIFSSTL